MGESKIANIQEVTWDAVRKEVKKINPELAGIIDDISPSKDYTLFRAAYNYGDHIIKKGVLQLPHQPHGLLPIADPNIPTYLKAQLGYNWNTNPVSLILNKSIEIFYIVDNYTIPLYGIVPPGKIFSTWKALSTIPSHGPPFIWDMTAGARSIFFLPKVSENLGHKRLCDQFNIHVDKPNHLLEQWNVLKAITRSSQFTQSWQTELLFFGKKWFEQLEDDAFIYFQRYLFQQAWNGSNFFRHQFIWELVFSLIWKETCIKYEPYIIDTVKHLLLMGTATMPGYTCADNDLAAPVAAFQSIYNDVYRLKPYAPMLFVPAHLTHDKPVYYSLAYPTAPSFSPRRNSKTGRIHDLVNIQKIMRRFLEQLTNNTLNLGPTPISQIPHTVQYDYFHKNNTVSTIKNSRDIPIEDSHIQKGLCDKNFADNSPFLQGCIKVCSTTE